MMHHKVHTLINQQNGSLAFKLFSFDENSHFDYLQSNNFYSIIWLKNGNCILNESNEKYEVQKGTLLAFAPYQPFFLSSESKIQGIAIQFHSDFFCIYANHSDIGCEGILFNNMYEAPVIQLTQEHEALFDMLVQQMTLEVQRPDIAQYEQIISYLKIFLITAVRIKAEQSNLYPIIDNPQSGRIKELKDLIEKNYRNLHAPSDYATLMHITANSLAKLVKTQTGKTLTNLISERIINEAKKQLYVTNKSVKEIARDLGYDDEHHFSRYFKNHTEVSPQTYRDTITFRAR